MLQIPQKSLGNYGFFVRQILDSGRLPAAPFPRFVILYLPLSNTPGYLSNSTLIHYKFLEICA